MLPPLPQDRTAVIIGAARGGRSSGTTGAVPAVTGGRFG
jgi:hypothetical protein